MQTKPLTIQATVIASLIALFMSMQAFASVGKTPDFNWWLINSDLEACFRTGIQLYPMI